MSWDMTLRTLAALVLVLGMIAGVAALARRFGLAGGVGGSRGRRRLAVVEMLPVDSRRRLLLVRKDQVEHLLLIGGPTDILVEKGVIVDGRAEAQSERVDQ
jgi:flagellar protein FliO/FliZ